MLEDLKFEIEYFFKNNIILPIKEIKTGIKNLIKWFPIIWKDRWYDYYYLDSILKFKLKDMYKHWAKDTHYIGAEHEVKILKKLIKILDEIEEIENSCNINEEHLIDKKYQEFGRLLFDIKKRPLYNENGKTDKFIKTSTIRTLWD